MTITDATERLAEIVRSTTRLVSIPRRIRQLPKPALCPADTRLWRSTAGSLGKRGVEEAFQVWEQLVYGFVATSELRDEGYSPSSWVRWNIRSMIPLLSGFASKSDDAAFPLALYAISQLDGCQLIVDGGDVTVINGPYPIGVVQGKALSLYSGGVELSIDPTVLTSPLPGVVRVSGVVPKIIYEMIHHRRDASIREEGLALLAYILFNGGERAINRRFTDKGLLAEYKLLKATEKLSYPTDTEVEEYLIAYEGDDVTRHLRKLIGPSIMNARTFESHFGTISYRAKNVNNKKYDLIYKYRDFIGAQQC